MRYWISVSIQTLIPRCLPSIASLDRKSTRLNSSHTVIYTLSLHDALPISFEVRQLGVALVEHEILDQRLDPNLDTALLAEHRFIRSEEHTSELQSHSDLHSFPTRRSSDLLRSSAARRSSCRA